MDNMKLSVGLILSLAVLPLLAAKQPYERYQSIVDRQMFGPLPPGFDPTKLPSEVTRTTAADEKQLTQEQEKLQSSIHFSVINVTPEGDTAVGFTDNSDPKQPVHYYLKVGESRNGWLVKEADPAKASMTIAKDDVEVSLTIGGNSASGGGTTSRAGDMASAGGGLNRIGGGSLGHRPGGLLGGSGSLRARRLQREQAMMEERAKADAASAAKEAERRAAAEAQAEQERQQREAERAEQRQQLLAIQEELKKVREAKTAAEAAAPAAPEGENANAEN